MQIAVLNTKGQKIGKMQLPKGIFEVKASEKLLTQAVLRQLANLRRPIAQTKTRGQVRGGGIKPFRQKGTGRARAGTIRSPLWRGGGVVFGPTGKENFKQKIPKKMKRKAIFSALSVKAKESKIIIVDKIVLPHFKTKEMEQILQNLPLEEDSTILMVLGKPDEKVEKSAKNLPYLKMILASNLNLLDLLKYDFLILDKVGLDKVKEIFQGSKR